MAHQVLPKYGLAKRKFINSLFQSVPACVTFASELQLWLYRFWVFFFFFFLFSSPCLAFWIKADNYGKFSPQKKDFLKLVYLFNELHQLLSNSGYDI